MPSAATVDHLLGTALDWVAALHRGEIELRCEPAAMLEAAPPPSPISGTPARPKPNGGPGGSVAFVDMRLAMLPSPPAIMIGL